MTQKYREGNYFAVPLGRGTFAIGLIARQPRRGSVLLGYFFGRRYTQAELTALDLKSFKPTDAKLVCRFKDGGLHRGAWRVFAVSRDWRREDWPIPSFIRKEGLSGRGIRVEYDGDTLTVPIRQLEAGVTDTQNLTDDLVMDDERVKEFLERLLLEDKTSGTVDPGQWTR